MIRSIEPLPRDPRPRRRAALRAVAMLLLVGSPAQALTVDELPAGVEYRVRAVRVQGADAVRAAVIRDAMVTRVPPWYELWRRWRTRTMLSRVVLRGDLERVAQVLRDAGYYHARVAHDLQVDDRRGRVVIVLTIEEGAPTLVDDVTLDVVDFAPTREQRRALHDRLVLAPGDVFTRQAYDESRVALAGLLATTGWAYATVTKSARVDTDRAVATVRYAVVRGPAATFGGTRITGDDRVAAGLIEREITWRAGDAWNAAELARTQERIFGLGLFKSVIVRPVEDAAQRGVVDVAIDVAEAPAREIQVGAGYGDEEGPRGVVRWRHNNWLGGGRRLTVALRGSTLFQELVGELRQPHFLHPQQALVIPLTQAREDEPGYEVARTRLAPRIERELTPGVLAVLAYNIEYDEVTDVPDATLALIGDVRKSGLLSSVIARLEWSTADEPFNPHRGSRVQWLVEQAGGPWQGDWTFARSLLDLRHYVPLPAERVVATRFRLGTGDGFGQSGDLPVFRRFYAGGTESVRGFGRHRLGPLNEFDSPVGGRTAAELSLELRTPVWGALGGVAFFDVGMVRLEPFSFAVNDLQYGAGVGVRFHTVVGPLRLDVGFPVDPPPGDPTWRLHFSIGQAF